MKIFFNEPLRYEPWGGGVHFLVNFVKFLREKGHKVIFKLKKIKNLKWERDIDLIFILSNSKPLDQRIIKYKQKFPETKVLHRINECDKRKNTHHINNIIFKINKIADETIFISKWLADYFVKKDFKKQYHVIYNGCNPKYFYLAQNKKLGDKTNLVTHHWSSYWLKGFDIYIKIDKILNERDDITFTYIGNYNSSHNPRNTKIIPPLYGMKLGNELRKYDIYVTASRWEPCGMHHIEGARCGLPVLYHAEGGGINESCKNYGLEFNDISSLFDGINKIKRSYQDYRNKIPYEFLSIERCCEEYYKKILNLLG